MIAREYPSRPYLPAVRRLSGSGLAYGLHAIGVVLSASFALPAQADRLPNRVAVFSALDKVTATIKSLEIPLNETIEYGALKVTPRVCYSRPPTVQPKTTSFVEVDEVQLDGTEKRIFSGWMFAESPGLNAVEHPVFDVWLTACKEPSEPTTARAPRPSVDDNTGTSIGEPYDPFQDFQRRRVRR